jgi:hypothetical protein
MINEQEARLEIVANGIVTFDDIDELFKMCVLTPALAFPTLSAVSFAS